MVADSKVFIVARNKHLVPKRRRVERLPSGYSVREARDDSQGNYWYVVTALDVIPPRNAWRRRRPADHPMCSPAHRCRHNRLQRGYGFYL